MLYLTLILNKIMFDHANSNYFDFSKACLGFASGNSIFLMLTICTVILEAMQYLYNPKIKFVVPRSHHVDEFSQAQNVMFESK